MRIQLFRTDRSGASCSAGATVDACRRAILGRGERASTMHQSRISDFIALAAYLKALRVLVHLDVDPETDDVVKKKRCHEENPRERPTKRGTRLARAACMRRTCHLQVCCSWVDDVPLDDVVRYKTEQCPGGGRAHYHLSVSFVLTGERLL
eukprot:scaffold22390_cov28-Tisochrysis_lutea.AAC.9